MLVSKYVSLDHQPCQARSLDIDINSNEALYYWFTVSVNKCGGRCNSTDDGYAWVCVPNKVKKLNIQIDNLMLSVSETRLLIQNHDKLLM